MYLDKFRELLLRSCGKTMAVREVALLYVNSIPFNGWKDFGEMGKVFSCQTWHRAEEAFLPTPRTVEWQARFEMEKDQGVLFAVCSPLFTDDGSPQGVTLTLEARNTLPEKEFMGWFNKGRMWIVKGFAELTTKAMQTSHWGKRNS